MNIADLPLKLLSMAARYSALAYSGFVSGKKYSCWWTSAEAYLLQTETTNILVHTGTKQPLDFLIDLTAFPWKRGSWSHAGFNLSHWSVWRKIAKDIDPSKPTLVCGHSLGGAHAEKSCEFMAAFTDVSLITFGKPNVYLKGHQPSMEHLRHRISVVSGSDIVTRLPRYMYGPALNQTKLYLANDDNDYVDPPAEFIRQDWSRQDMFSDHSMTELYVKRIDRIIDRLLEQQRA